MQELRGEKGTLIVFMCNNCPFVIHLLSDFTKLVVELKTKGISSNDIDNYPMDNPDNMIEL